jgi:hypothetical protein
MTYRILFALIATLCFAACDTSDEIKPITLLTFTADNSVPLPGRDNWIIISDANGNLIDSKLVEIMQPVVLSGAIGSKQKINVTFFYCIEGPSFCRDMYFFKSYCGIEPGAEWSEENLEPASLSGNVGNFKVALTGLPSNGQVLWSLINNDLGAGALEFSGSNQTMTAGLTNKATDVFARVSEPTSRKYIRIQVDASHVDQIFSFQYPADFSSFDHSLTISHDLEKFSTINVTGYNSSSYYTSFGRDPFLPHCHKLTSYNALDHIDGQAIDVDYNNNYETYLTQWSTYPNNNIQVSYFKLGQPPVATNFDIANADLKVLNEDINNFEIQLPSSCAYTESYFSFSSNPCPSISWNVYASSSYQGAVLKTLPEDLAKDFPFVGTNFSQVMYWYTVMVVDKNGQTYDNFIGDLFATQKTPFEREYYSVKKMKN